MAETALVFGVGGAAIGAVVLDAAPSETHTSELEVTQHPVESGASISDHARLKPSKLVMDCIVTDDSLRVAGREGRASEAYQQLLQLQADATLLSVVTSLRTYENMVLETLSVPRTAKEAFAIHFSATFTEIRLVQNKTTIVEVTKEPIAKKKVSTGKQSANSADDSKEKSWLKSLSDHDGLSKLLGVQ